ncbi:MAG: endonuclease/exonuclease/phosphatase family protein [Acidimicrobiales bacterium]
MHELATTAPRRPQLGTTQARPDSGAFVVGTFNLHAGVDGWGRPFDVVAACRTLDADLLVLEENWAPDDEPSVARSVADALGYDAWEQALAGGRLARPHPRADGRWMRSMDWRGASHAIYLDSERPYGDNVTRSRRYVGAQQGHWGIALLSRLPVVRVDVIDMGRLRRDRARRAALVAEVRVGPHTVTVVGTHMSHLTYGAPRQFLALRRRLAAAIGDGPAVLAGDMNLWGPPVAALLWGWRRAVRSKTWPAWRPHSHVDHVLIRGALQVVCGEVLGMAGSDHLPVRATLRAGGRVAR